MRIAGCEGSSVWSKASKQASKQTNKPHSESIHTPVRSCAVVGPRHARCRWRLRRNRSAQRLSANASRGKAARQMHAVCAFARFVHSQCFGAFVCLFVHLEWPAHLFVCCLFVCLRTFNTASTIAGTNGSIAFGARFATSIIVTRACDSLHVFAFPVPSFAFSAPLSLS